MNAAGDSPRPGAGSAWGQMAQNRSIGEQEDVAQLSLGRLIGRFSVWGNNLISGIIKCRMVIQRDVVLLIQAHVFRVVSSGPSGPIFDSRLSLIVEPAVSLVV